MTLSWNWWWDTSSEDLRSVENPFIAITPSSTLTRSSSICKSPIYESNRSVYKSFVFDRNSWYDINICKKFWRHYTKHFYTNIQCMQFPNFYVWNIPRWVDMLLRSINQVSNHFSFKKIFPFIKWSEMTRKNCNSYSHKRHDMISSLKRTVE